MRKIFTILFTVLFASGLFAATEQAWYSDVTSITNNGQYYIYSVAGKGFMQGGNSKVKAVTQNNYNSESNLLFTISTTNNRTYTGSNYLCSYETQTCGPVGGTNTSGSTMIWEGKSGYWLVYGSYTFIWAQKAYLRYESNAYNATCLNPDLDDSKFHWYLVSPAQYDRHWAIYLYDRYKESIADYTKWENLVPAAYYTALTDAYAVTYNVKNTEHSKEVVNEHRADLKALYDNAAAVADAYANAKAAIDALEAVEDKGEDFAEVTAGITAARTAIEAAMSVDALNAAVSAPALKGIDPITFNVTTFIAGKDLGTPASTTAGRTITYDAADKTIINAAGLPIYKGTTKLTATAAATNDYYKFVRSANVTVDAEDTEAEETKTITYGDNESWHGKDLSAYTVGQHTLTFDTLNIYGGAHKITLTLTVNKIETLNVPVELSFCEGGSQFYRGVEYKAAGTYPVNATGAVRDTVYNVTVTILQPTTGTDTKTITFGDDAEWNGIALKDSTVGVHTVTYVTENAAGCDSTVTLTLTVNKLETLNVPVELSFCEGGSEFYRGVEYKTAGTYPVNATGAVRDTVYNVIVTVLQPTTGTDTKTITFGDDAEWNGIALKDSTVGVHTVTYVTTNAVGCDSTVTLTLTVNKIETLNVPVELSFCEGSSELYRGVEYKTAGTYPVNVTGAVRDTVYNVTVTVLQPTTGTDTKTIVCGAEESWNGIALKDSTVGVHYVVYTTTNIAGCDSTVTLTLTVTKADVVEVPVELVFCAGDSAEYREVWYKEAGFYPVYVEDAVRDTVYNVTVTVNEPSATSTEMTITFGDDVEWNGIALKDSTVGVHYVVYETTNIAGCDSIVTLTLTVEKMEALETEKELEFCEGDSVEYRGEWYSIAGEYPVLVEDDVRDTLINVIVTVHEKTYAEIERTVLAGNVLTLPEGEWTIGDQVVSGTYETLRGDTLGLELYQYDETEFGCESVVKLIVTVTPNYEAIDHVFVGEQAQKFFQNGAIYIRRGEKEYSVDGRLVK